MSGGISYSSVLRMFMARTLWLFGAAVAFGVLIGAAWF